MRLVIVLLCILAAGDACARRSTSWTNDVMLADGQVVQVRQTRSIGYFVSTVHGGFYPLGKDPRHELTIEDRGQHIRWTGTELPVIINKYGGKWYMVFYDCETGKDDFPILVLENGSWNPLPKRAFPREISLQNLNAWMFGLEPQYCIMLFTDRQRLNPEERTDMLAELDRLFVTYPREEDWQGLQLQFILNLRFWAYLEKEMYRWDEHIPRATWLAFRIRYFPQRPYPVPEWAEEQARANAAVR